VAAGLEAQGDYDKAITAFQGVAARYPNDSAAERAKLALGGLYAAKNQPQQALRLYEELAKPASMSGLATEAAMKRRDLLRKHPELAAAIKPAVPSPGAASTNLVVTNAPGAKAPATNQTSGKPSPAQAPSP
jgi:tetratricopeptide (TPR) repeat protein